MITTINEYDFINAFKTSELRKEQFSYEALKSLFEYYEQYEEGMEERIEFDMIAICCEWTEYKDIDEVKATYSSIEDLQDLEDNTQVISFDEGLLVMNY